MICDRSYTQALVVIHKCRKPVISAWMPKSSVQGWQTLAYYIAQMKHSFNRQVTVHGLDFGIRAEMTVFVGVVGLVYNSMFKFLNWLKSNIWHGI